MKLTQKQQHEMMRAARDLMLWMGLNCHPHCTAVVDSESITLTEVVAASSSIDRLIDPRRRVTRRRVN